MRLFGSLWSSFVSCCWRCATSAVPEEIPPHRSRRLINPAILVIACGIAVWCSWQVIRARQTQSNVPAGPTIQQVQALAELVTAKVTIADARETTLSGYLGDVKALLVIRGDSLLGPDLSKAKILTIDPEAKTIVILLPRPHLISYRLDHTATRLVSLSHDGLWVIVPGDAGRTAVLNRAFAEAERAVADAAVTDQTIDEATVHAKQALTVFFNADGWRVTFQLAANH